jgi:leucyl aminopeptidase
MDIKLETKAIADVESDAVVIVGFEDESSAAGGDAGKELYSTGEFTGKDVEIAILHRPQGMKAKRLVLAGGGKREKFDSAALRKLTGTALRMLKSKGARSIVFAPDEPFRSNDFAAAAVEGALLGNFEPNTYKTDPKKDEKQVDWFAVLGGTQSAIDRGRILGESQNFQPGFPKKRAKWRRSRVWIARFWMRRACASWAWARCWALRREALSLRR